MQLVLSPSEQIRELSEALEAVVGSEDNTQAAREMADEVVQLLAQKNAERWGRGMEGGGQRCRQRHC